MTEAGVKKLMSWRVLTQRKVIGNIETFTIFLTVRIGCPFLLRSTSKVDQWLWSWIGFCRVCYEWGGVSWVSVSCSHKRHPFEIVYLHRWVSETHGVLPECNTRGSLRSFQYMWWRMRDPPFLAENGWSLFIWTGHYFSCKHQTPLQPCKMSWVNMKV